MRTGAGLVALLCAFMVLASGVVAQHDPIAPADAPPAKAEPDDATRRQAIAALTPWAGLDLSLIPAGHRAAVDAATAVLTGAQTNVFEPFVPWYFWDISERPWNETPTEKYLYLEMQPAMMVPGGSSARVTVLSGQGRVLGVSVLNTGWRANPSAALLERVYDHPSRCAHQILQINHVPTVSSHSGRQFYGLIGNEFHFLRVEDTHGESFRNSYWAPNLAFGPVFAPASVEDCLAMLRDTDRLVHLRAAAWLAGVHFKVLDPTKPSGYDVLHEDEKAAWIAGQCYESAEIKTELERLAQDERDQWTRDAAEMALKPELDD